MSDEKAPRRRLGRGLDALLAGTAPAGTPGETPRTSPRKVNLYPNLPVDTVFSGPYQPRRVIRQEGLEELAQSIRAQGVIEPIVVRPRASGGYEIVAGERRWRAAQLAGLESIPAVVRDIGDREALAMALIENIQREDLNPLEEAHALRRLLDEFATTQQELADLVGKSRTAVANLLRLLNLTPRVQAMLADGRLEMGHARALLPLPDGEQESAAARVTARSLSVRQTEALVRRLLSGEAPKPAPQEDADTRRLARELSERIGAPVSIGFNRHTRAGQVVIRYTSMDELDGILKHLRGRRKKK